MGGSIYYSMKIPFFSKHIDVLTELYQLINRHRILAYEMAKQDVFDRYLGQYFGVLWAFSHPLITIAIFVFIFTFIFLGTVSGAYSNFGYPVFLISGLIPWIAIQDVMSKSSTLIINHGNLVKQVVFPLEILPVKATLGTLFTQLCLMFFFLVYILAVYHALPTVSLLLIPLFLIQSCGMLGMSFALSATGVFFRDMKDFIQVFCGLAIYFMPVIYTADRFPPCVRWVFYVNPLSYVFLCYQDAIFYGRITHPEAWAVITVCSAVSLLLGYKMFKLLKPMFGNVL